MHPQREILHECPSTQFAILLPHKFRAIFDDLGLLKCSLASSCAIPVTSATRRCESSRALLQFPGSLCDSPASLCVFSECKV